MASVVVKAEDKEFLAKAFVFDMDGVLIDSEPLHFKSCQDFLQPYNVSYTQADHAQFIGTTDEYMWNIYSQKYQINISAKQFIEEREKILVELITNGAVARPGVYDFLEQLKQLDVPVAVASSSSLATIAVVLEALNIRHYFECIASGEEVAHGKPAPDVFLLAAERLSVAPQHCVVIEDSHNGTKAAKAAGTYCIAIPCEETRNQDHSRADVRLDSLASIVLQPASTRISDRRAVAADVEKLERIIQYAYRGGKATGSWTNEYSLVKGPRITTEQLHEILAKEDQALLVAELEENGSTTLAGCIRVDKLKDGQAYFGMLAIDPDLQSRGVGKKLFAAAEEHAKNVFGCHTARGSVLAPRDELLAWYRRLGYEENGETEPFLSPESGVTPLVDNLYFRVIVKKLISIALLLLVTLGCVPAFALESGIGAVDDYVLHDKQRNKELHMRITYPTEEGKFPVIIFSHGAGGSKDGYRYLINNWVKNGFVCIQPSHADAITNTTNKEQLFQNLMNSLKVLPVDYTGWANRVADIKLILSSLSSIQSAIPAVIDTTHVGLAGHSYGAFTSMLIGGATVPKIAASKVKKPYDGRIAAILVISPQGIKRRPRDFGFDNKASWKGISGPAMFMTGSLDQTGWTTAKDRRVPYLDSPAGNKYFVQIKGANHLTFAGVSQTEKANRPIIGQQIAKRIQQRKQELGLTTTGRLAKFFGPMESGDHQQMLDAIELVSTDFFDAYLKDLASDKQALQSKALEKENSVIQIEFK